jgi:hypothetical protein
MAEPELREPPSRTKRKTEQVRASIPLFSEGKESGQQPSDAQHAWIHFTKSKPDRNIQVTQHHYDALHPIYRRANNMNQQTLMAALSAYPSPKASDELLWQMLNQAWRNEEPARHRNVREGADDDVSCTQSLMSGKIEKMLLTTRQFWATC